MKKSKILKQSRLAVYVDEEEGPPLDLESGAFPGVDHWLILVTSPDVDIKGCIQACKDFTSGNVSGSAHIKRLDHVWLKDESLEALLACHHDHSLELMFEMSFRKGDGIRTLPFSDQAFNHSSWNGLKQDLKAQLMPCDYSRACFFMADTGGMRKNLSCLRGEIFNHPGGVWALVNPVKFCKPPTLETSVLEKDNLPEAASEVGSMLYILNKNKKTIADSYYDEVSSRCVLKALKDLLYTEHEFQMIERRGKEMNRVDLDYDGKIIDGQSPDRDNREVIRCSNCGYIMYGQRDQCDICEEQLGPMLLSTAELMQTVREEIAAEKADAKKDGTKDVADEFSDEDEDDGDDEPGAEPKEEPGADPGFSFSDWSPRSNESGPAASPQDSPRANTPLQSSNKGPGKKPRVCSVMPCAGNSRSGHEGEATKNCNLQ